MMIALGMKVMGWLGLGDAAAKRFAWLPWALAALLVVVIVIKVATNWFDTAIDTAKDAGAAGAIIRGQEQTLDQLGDANDAEEKLESGGERSSQRYAGCLRDALEPANCERYNPKPRKQ